MPARRCDVTATDLDDAGAGIGTGDGRHVHVVDLLPGERAEVALDHESPHRAEAWGRIVRRIGAPSADRVTPACPAFGRCGGCAWQHLAYPAQLAAKQRRVAHALANVPTACAVGGVRPSPSELGYRNKGKYVAGTAHGHLILGAYAPRTHAVVDTLGCRVVAPVIDEVASWLRGAAERAGVVAYDEATRAGELRYAVVRSAATTEAHGAATAEAHGDVLVALVVTSHAARDKLADVARALAKHPAVRGVVTITNDRRDGAIVPSGSSAQVLHGHGHVTEELAGVPVAVGAAEFLQVNRGQAAAMYARVGELALPSSRDAVDASTPRAPLAIDLFAGLGGIGLTLARAGARVIALEIDREAVGQLRRAAERASLPLVALAGDAAGALPALRAELQDADPDIVVVNPPRKGLGDAGRELVAALAPATLVYVSCGPESLADDVRALAGHGYACDAIEPFDLMPGTAQIETVVRLRRG